jgi:hypothetical protein
VAAFDNALPHLTADQLRRAVGATCSKLKSNGLFIASIRDYDTLILEKPAAQEPAFYGGEGDRRIIHQVWDWTDAARYTLHLYITMQGETLKLSAPVFSFRIQYQAFHPLTHETLTVHLPPRPHLCHCFLDGLLGHPCASKVGFWATSPAVPIVCFMYRGGICRLVYSCRPAPKSRTVALKTRTGKLQEKRIRAWLCSQSRRSPFGRANKTQREKCGAGCA